MTVLGKVAGTMLKDNLVRNGVDLIIDTTLMYYDVSNRRIGINTTLPTNALTVNGSVSLSNIYINNNSVTSLNGNLIFNTSGNISASNNWINDVKDPVTLYDVATKNYVDTQFGQINQVDVTLSNGSVNSTVPTVSTTLYWEGTANQINVDLSGSTFTFSLNPSLSITSLTASGQVNGYLNGPIGANSANSAVFTSVNTVNGGQINGYINGPIGANSANSASFTSLLVSGQSNLNTISANTINAQAIGSSTSSLYGVIETVNQPYITSIGTLSSLSVTGDISIGGNISAGGQITVAYLNGNIGANTPANGTFNDVTITGNLSYDGSTALTNANIGNFSLINNTITVTNADGSINLVPFGVGTVNVNTTTALTLPVGNNLNRPDIPTQGMLRFNTASATIEVYNGSYWEVLSSNISTNTISDKFTGDGNTTDFTLTADSTTSGTLVTINGVIQIPDIAYTVYGNVLTLVEPPLTTDVIEARILSTTASINSVAEGNSAVRFDSPSNNYAILFSVNNTEQISVGSANTNVYNNLVVSNSTLFANGVTIGTSGLNSSSQNVSLVQNTLTTIDTFKTTNIRTAKYIISVSDFVHSKYQSAEILVNHNGSTTNITSYGIVVTGTNSPFVTFDANISGTTLSLQANSTSSSSYCNVQQIYVPV
jgi:hypothetical protein